MRFLIPFFIFTLLFYSCHSNLYNDISLDEFIIEEGFSIDLVAAEPLLDSPMAMAFDDKGRIWVAEMPGYMRDIEGTEEHKPDGRIVILEDRNGDGQMDKRKIFLDNLVLPRALCFAYGGLLYVETPNLYWTSIENDQAGKRELVDSLYVRGGNIEHQPNGLLYNIDNWIYSAKSDVRYRRKNGKWLKEATTFRGQWGITNDDVGHLYYNDNSNPLFGDFMLPNTLIQNPYQKIRHGLQQNIAKDRRVYPYQATVVNRGYQEGVLDTLTEKLIHFTSSCSPLIYRGEQFPWAYQKNAFVCGPEVNLVKRFTMHSDGFGGFEAKQAYESKEFLISKDETFRPINLYNAPDGSMYVLDLRKGVIQHRAYMSRYLYDKIKKRDLDAVTGIGRIYKITYDNIPVEKVRLPEGSDFKKWLELLKNPNSWQRERAQRWLIDHKELADKKALEEMVLQKESLLAQVHALWVLEGLDMLDGKLMVQLAEQQQGMGHPAWTVLLKLSHLLDKEQRKVVFDMASKESSRLAKPYLAYAVGQEVQEGSSKRWLEMGDYYMEKPFFVEALISGINGFEQELYDQLPNSNQSNDTLKLFLKEVLDNIASNEKHAPELKTEKLLDRRNRGMNLYGMHCGSCHGLEGKGLENLAPPLYQSEYIAGDPEKLILITLHGMKGAVTVQGKTYDFKGAMPGYKHNTTLTDEMIADILSFIRNGFGTDPSSVSPELVAKIRAETKDRTELCTEKELIER